MTTRRNSSLALATQPVGLVSVIAQTARGITQTYVEASDRRDQRRVLLDAYVAQLAAADRQDARAHDSLRALIALAEQLVAAGHVEGALEVLTRMAPIVERASAPALPQLMSGDR
jgi:hypothetical protein